MEDQSVPLCFRNACPQNDAKEQADRSSCSQSPHDKAVVARCAQGRTICLLPLVNWGVRRPSLDARSRGSAKPPLREPKRKIWSVPAFLLPLTASASSLLRQSRLETLLARRVGEPRKNCIVRDVQPFDQRQKKDRRRTLVGRA